MSNQVAMVHAQECTLILQSGHAYSFRRGEPTNVQQAHVDLIMAKGAAPADPNDAPKTIPEAPDLPRSAEDRNAAILAVMQKLVDENDPEKFDANGQPRVPVLTQACGFKVDTQDRNTLWRQYRENKGGNT